MPGRCCLSYLSCCLSSLLAAVKPPSSAAFSQQPYQKDEPELCQDRNWNPNCIWLVSFPKYWYQGSFSWLIFSLCKQVLQAFTISLCCHTGPPPYLQVIRWYSSTGLPRIDVKCSNQKNGEGIPSLRDGAK